MAIKKFRSIYFILTLLFFGLVSCFQNENPDNPQLTEDTLKSDAPLTEEDIIKQIREKCNEIDENLNTQYTYKKMRYIDNKKQGDYIQSDFDCYYETDNNLAKLVIKGGDEGVYEEINYYFSNGELIFNFSKWEVMDAEASETRLYYSDNKIIRALEKKAASTDADVDLSKIKNTPYPEFEKDKTEFEKQKRKEFDYLMNQLKDAKEITE